MNDITERQKEKIKNELLVPGKSAVMFDRYGIKPFSFSILDEIARVLEDEPDIRLEATLHTTGDETPVNAVAITERWARELAYYFRDRGTGMRASGFKGMGSSYPMGKPMEINRPRSDGVIALIFMKNEQ